VSYAATGGSFSHGVLFVTGSGNNTVSVLSVAANAPMLVFGGAGDDSFFVTPPTPGGSSAPGTLSLDAGGGSNQLSISESTATADTLFLTSNALVSTVTSFVVSYTATGGSFGRGLLLTTGSGNDTLLVLGTAAGADTHIFTQGGTDLVEVRTTNA